MKTPIFFSLVGIFFVLIDTQPTTALQLDQHPDEYPNYVVIGAFAIQDNAIKYAEHAHASGFQAAIDINPVRKLYYVYVLSTADHTKAIQEAVRLRRESAYTEAWVFYGQLGDQKNERAVAEVDVDPVTTQKIDTVKQQAQSPPIVDPPVITTPVAVESNDQMAVPEGDGKPFFFRLFRAVDGKQVEGKVDIIDTDRARKIGTYKGNEPVRVSFTANKSGTISVVCQAFGYHKAQREINYNNPSAEDITIEQDVTIIPFDLIRLKKGDIAIMYNVFFFKDAAIMRPESAYEVNSLLEMMKEEPTRKIRIHGHTNGNASGRIISTGETKNFFSLDGSNDGFGTAKNLSDKRANVIRDYLISKGVEENRMETKAWGGKKSIHDKNGPRAQENVRVEIEILED